jgi:hypothetical protein
MSTDRNGCTEIQAQIPLYAGGDLESPLADGVEEHLRTCRACAEELGRLRRALEPLRELRRDLEPPSIDVWPGVRAALEGHGLLASERSLERAAAEVRGEAPAEAPADPVSRPRPLRRTLVHRLGSLAAAAAIAAFAWIQWRSDGARPAPGTGTNSEPAAAPHDPARIAFQPPTPEQPRFVSDPGPSEESLTAESSIVDPRLATNADPLAPLPSGRLRRAGPDEERMRDFASPYLISPAREGPTATFVGYDRGIR